MDNWIIILLFLLSACSACNVNDRVSDMEDSKEIFIPLTKREYFTVEDLFSEYHYVQLETNEQCLLPGWEELRRILIDEEGKIYVGALHKVFVFHPDGRLDWVLDRRGDGPESYNHLWNFRVKANGDIAVIETSYAITTYDKEGNYLNKQRFIGIGLDDMVYLNDSLMLLKQDGMQQLDYIFYLANAYTGHLQGGYTPMIARNKWVYSLKTFFYEYEHKLLHHGYQSNDIYEMYPDTALLRYRINVDNRIPPEDFWRQEGKDGMQIRMEWSRSGYIGHIPYYVESDSLIFLRFEGGQKELCAYATIDKKTRATRLMKRLIFDDRFNWEPEVVFSLRDGWCVIPLYPDKVLTNPLFAARFPGLNEESNPVLFIGKLK